MFEDVFGGDILGAGPFVVVVVVVVFRGYEFLNGAQVEAVCDAAHPFPELLGALAGLLLRWNIGVGLCGGSGGLFGLLVFGLGF